MIHAAAVAVRTELLTVLRTRELYGVLVLPAALGAPLLVAAVVLVASWFGRTVVAVPLDAPFDALGSYEVLRVADPAAALADGAADLAVTSVDVHLPDVPRGTWSPVPRAAAWWTVTLAAADGDDVDGLATRVRDQAREAVDREIRDRATTPGRAREVARRKGGAAARDRAIDPRGMLIAGLVAFSVYGACMLVPTRTFAERASGMLESISVTRTPVVMYLGARVGVTAAVTGAVLTLPVLGVAWLVPGASLGLQAVDLVEAVAIGAAMTVGFVGCGLAAPSSRGALTLASNLYLVMFAALAFGSFTHHPWVPVLGTPLGADGQLVRLGITSSVGSLGFAVLGWVARGERLLPPGGPE